MKTILKAGIALGVLWEIWAYLDVAAGWHKSPATFNRFWLVIPIEIGVLVWALRQTAAERRGYGGQLGVGTATSVIGGILVATGYLCMTAVFPHYVQEIAALQEQTLRAAGKSDVEIRQLMEVAARTSSPAVSAILAGVGTVVTGFVSSLVIAAFVRAKTGAAAAAA